MENLILQAEAFRNMVKRFEKEIDNPVLILSVLTELDNLIEYLTEEE